MSVTVRTDQNSSKNIYGDPPKINFNLPEIIELTQNFKSWKDVQLPIDILLLTVKDCEFISCYYYIVDPFRSYFKGLGHVYFGGIGEDQDDKLKVALMKCSEGSKVPVDGLTVVKNAVTQLRPLKLSFLWATSVVLIRNQQSLGMWFYQKSSQPIRIRRLQRMERNFVGSQLL